MTLAFVGELALWVATLFALWGIAVSAAANPLHRADLARSGARAVHAVAGMQLLALLALAVALVRRDFSLTYVAAYGGTTATPLELLVALWAAPAGALAGLGVAIAGIAIVGQMTTFRRGGVASSTGVAASANACVLLLSLGVLATLLGWGSPFERLSFAAGDGRGLPPPLRAGVAMLLLPLWALTVACATMMFAIAVGRALIPDTWPSWAARADDVRDVGARWALGAWLLHSAALVASLWWSHGVPAGDAGWIARAVPLASAAAWLTLGIAAHLPAIERRRRLRAGPRTVLIALPLLMLLVSPLLEAEGGWQPLHELSHGAGGAWWIVSVAALVQVLVYVLIQLRARRHGSVRGDDQSPSPAGSLAAATGGPVRPRPARLGAALSHVGIGIAVAGLLGSQAAREHVLQLNPGESQVVGDPLGRSWSVVYQGLSIRERRTALGDPRWRELLLPVSIARSSSPSAAGELVVPEVREHVDVLFRPTAPPWPVPDIHHLVLQDIVIEPDSLGDAEGVRMRIAFIPFVGLVWLGGAVLLTGGLFTLLSEWR